LARDNKSNNPWTALSSLGTQSENTIVGPVSIINLKIPISSFRSKEKNISHQRDIWEQTTVSCSAFMPQLQLNFLSRPRCQRNQHIQTEFLELAAYQVGDARLGDA
jgi:hypothetical protein